MNGFRKELIGLYYKECGFILVCLESGNVLPDKTVKELTECTESRELLNQIIDEIGLLGREGFHKFVDILHNVKETNAVLLLRQAERDKLLGREVQKEINQGM